jgi:hypothetical protein
LPARGAKLLRRVVERVDEMGMRRNGRGLSSIYLRRDSGLAEVGEVGASVEKRIAFGWYGGKFSHLKWLLPVLPECHHYCEPLAGSGAVLLNRMPALASREIEKIEEGLSGFR